MLTLVLLLAVSGAPAPTITTQSLLAELNDPQANSIAPSPAYRQLQASSYDRAQTDPNNPKTWHANADYGQFIRTEKHGDRTEWVAMEHHGPGAMTRIWTPLNKDDDKMLIRVYFDGSDKPSIETPFNDLMRGKGFIPSPFAFISWADPKVTDGVGSDSYFPIPFAKSCKVTFSQVPFYYSIDYRAYPGGTRVKPFDLGQMKSLRMRFPSNQTGETQYRISLRDGIVIAIKPHGVKTTVLHGSGAITRIAMRLPKDIDDGDLRSTIIEASFDGHETVWCPIGDFFGCGTRLRPVMDLFRSVSPDGLLTATWRMPYRKGAVVKIVNLGSQPVKLQLSINSDPRDKWNARSMYFHTTWRHQYPLATRPMSDWNYLTANGAGMYVGDTLTVMSPSPAWYGEGDERIYVDGEKFPSQLGTGTEDYYGYAWGMAEGFSSPFIAMPARDLKGRSNWRGYTTTSRIRGLDAIPFTKSLKFDMEVWDWADCQLEFSAATFWYARPGATCIYGPEKAEAAKPLPEVGGVIKGAIECETLPVIRKSDDVKVSIQSGDLVTQGSWSNGDQLFIQAYNLGDFVELRLPVRTAGRQHVILYATKSYDYGIARFSVNGTEAANVDLWSDKPVASGPIDLGVFDLKAGEAVFRFEVVGTNPHSRGDRFYTGLDCIVLKPTTKGNVGK
jgi:hypothetical protein